MSSTDYFADSGGMYLQVRQAGSKRWVLKYRVDGKEKQLAMGSYPVVSLTAAIKAPDAAKLQKVAGAGPVMVHKVEMLKASRTDGDTFNAIGMEWAELEPLTGHGVYVFPGERSHDRPISDNSVRCVLCALDFARNRLGMVCAPVYARCWRMN